MKPDCLHRFERAPDSSSLPEKFTFPFYYSPHQLAIQAAKEIQQKYLEPNPWRHNFGLDPSIDGFVIGKMFGVLVVKDSNNELGYLAAFSGKLADANHHEGFVPPVFDLLDETGFFKTEEQEVNDLTIRIEELEQSEELLRLTKDLGDARTNGERSVQEFKAHIKSQKAIRDDKRKQGLSSLSESEFTILENELKQESIALSYQLKEKKSETAQIIEELEENLNQYLKEINRLKEERRLMSNQLQQKIFKHYTFLNHRNEEKSLLSIFNELGIELPPAGAGECAAPKLLQYAYQHRLTPVTFAEFWWGASPKSEVRKHGEFYPSCRGKCEPILGHMLNGLEVDENPMLQNPAADKELDFVYEDEDIIIVNKPAEFLSVPGKNIDDSVYSRIKVKYPEATGPLLVHRLDMSTSGILLVAKNETAHRFLQRQFIKRTVKKRYVALLDGIVKEDHGKIELPLRVDLDNRPFQLVCYEHGKPALTHFEVLERRNNETLIHFYPSTGRTHQLRVHAAHQSGLNAPIKGDDLYGRKGERLHLHAEFLAFVHPSTRRKFKITIPSPF